MRDYLRIGLLFAAVGLIAVLVEILTSEKTLQSEWPYLVGLPLFLGALAIGGLRLPFLSADAMLWLSDKLSSRLESHMARGLATGWYGGKWRYALVGGYVLLGRIFLTALSVVASISLALVGQPVFALIALSLAVWGAYLVYSGIFLRVRWNDEGIEVTLWPFAPQRQAWEQIQGAAYIGLFRVLIIVGKGIAAIHMDRLKASQLYADLSERIGSGIKPGWRLVDEQLEKQASDE